MLAKQAFLLFFPHHASCGIFVSQSGIEHKPLAVKRQRAVSAIYLVIWRSPAIHPEKAMAPYSSTLAWKIPWTEEPGGLQSMGLLGVRYDFTFTFTFHFHALEKEMAAHSSVLAWRIPGIGEPGGLPSMGSHRVRHD